MTEVFAEVEPLVPLDDAPTLDFPVRDTKAGIVLSELPWCCYKKKMGNSYLCCERKNARGVPQVVCYCGSSWLCGLLTAICLYTPILAAAAFVLPRIHWGWGLGFAVIFGICAANHIKVSCCDPGVFPFYSAPKYGNWIELRPGIWVPPRSNRRGMWDWDEIKHAAGWAPSKCIRAEKTCCPYRGKNTDIKLHLSTDAGFVTINTDHFCCWTGTIIAGRNLFNFKMLFPLILTLIVYTGLISMYALETTMKPNFGDLFRPKKFF